MQIGRKIYYDKATGNVYVTTAEMSGDVVETTQEQDFQTYTALHGIDPATVGMIQLEFGQYADKFAQYPYHVDPSTQEIVWDTGWTFEQAVANKKAEISAAVSAKITAGYQSTLVLASTGKAHFYGTMPDDQINMSFEYNKLNGNPDQTTVDYRPQDEMDFVTHTRAEFKAIAEAVYARTKFYLAQGYAYYRQLAASQTVDEVNAIVVQVVDP
jgi:hypothetical protein